MKTKDEKHATDAAPRVERWRKIITDALTTRNDRYLIGQDTRAEIERIEGRPLAEVVLDAVKDERGLGVADEDPADRRRPSRRYEDEQYEAAPARIRNNHDRKSCYPVVRDFLHLPSAVPDMTPEDECAWIRAYYRKGDKGLRQAVRRAFLAGVALAAEEKQNRSHMKYADYSPETQALINRTAERVGVTPDEVVGRFEDVFSGKRLPKGVKRILTSPEK